MRIAFVVHDFHQSGGHSRYVSELAHRFSREHEVHVFANVVRDGAPSQVRFHHVPALRSSSLTTTLSFVLPATWLLPRDFEIIHAQGVCTLRADVVTAHICNQAWSEARRAAAKRLTVSERLFSAVVNPIERRFYRQPPCKSVIAVSHRVKHDLRAVYGHTAPITVIHHGVDGARFDPALRSAWRRPVLDRLGISGDTFVVLFAGDLRKGAEIAVAALRSVPAAVLLLVSDTAPRECRRAAEQHGVVDRVVFCPATERIEHFYAAADAFVLPTPYDAFGMVVAEAMASGLPAVTTREAGVSELITHGANGLLLDRPSAADQLAEFLTRLKERPAWRKDLGDAARATMLAQTWDQVALRTMEVYRTILAERAQCAG